MAVTGADMVDYDMSFRGDEEGGGEGSAVGAGGGTMAGIDSMLGSGGLGFGSVAESGAISNRGLGFGSMAEDGTMEVMVSGVMANNLVGNNGVQAPVVVASSGKSAGAAVGGVGSGGAQPGVEKPPLAPVRLGLVKVAGVQGAAVSGSNSFEVRRLQSVDGGHAFCTCAMISEGVGPKVMCMSTPYAHTLHPHIAPSNSHLVLTRHGHASLSHLPAGASQALG